jgi:hypothetical protein
MSNKPQYVIKMWFDRTKDEPLWYNDKVSNNGVARDKATTMSHKEARQIADCLKSRFKMSCIVEPDK